jgi:uncharacterized protein YndB with AHSA1/START domain
MELPAISWTTYIAAPRERVSLALTTAEGWDGWFTRGASIDARVGGELVLRWRDAARIQHRVMLWGAVHTEMEIVCAIRALDPPARFSFEWRTAGHATTVDFSLATRGGGTVVTLTERGYVEADLGTTGVVGEMGRSPFAMCASGWGEALTLLKFYIEHGISYGAVPPA